MENINSQLCIFGHETLCTNILNLCVREIKTSDQYGKPFKKSIKDFQTSDSICGYVASAIAPFLGETTPFQTNPSELELLLNQLNDLSLLVPEVEKCMEIIQAQRQQYITENPHEFKTKKDKEKYMKDWVANYEISDLLQIFPPLNDNVFFLRHVSFQYPNLVKDVKHEEKRRLVEEEQFQDQKFIIESFSKVRKLQTIDQWIYEEKAKKLIESNKSLVFVTDLLGHFVTILACGMKKEDGKIEKTLLLINSVEENYLKHSRCQEALFTIAQLVFPEEIFK